MCGGGADGGGRVCGWDGVGWRGPPGWGFRDKLQCGPHTSPGCNTLSTLSTSAGPCRLTWTVCCSLLGGMQVHSEGRLRAKCWAVPWLCGFSDWLLIQPTASLHLQVRGSSCTVTTVMTPPRWSLCSGNPRVEPAAARHTQLGCRVKAPVHNVPVLVHHESGSAHCECRLACGPLSRQHAQPDCVGHTGSKCDTYPSRLHPTWHSPTVCMRGIVCGGG